MEPGADEGLRAGRGRGAGFTRSAGPGPGRGAGAFQERRRARPGRGGGAETIRPGGRGVHTSGHSAHTFRRRGAAGAIGRDLRRHRRPQRHRRGVGGIGGRIGGARIGEPDDDGAAAESCEREPEFPGRVAERGNLAGAFGRSPSGIRITRSAGGAGPESRTGRTSPRRGLRPGARIGRAVHSLPGSGSCRGRAGGRRLRGSRRRRPWRRPASRRRRGEGAGPGAGAGRRSVRGGATGSAAAAVEPPARLWAGRDTAPPGGRPDRRRPRRRGGQPAEGRRTAARSRFSTRKPRVPAARAAWREASHSSASGKSVLPATSCSMQPRTASTKTNSCGA